MLSDLLQSNTITVLKEVVKFTRARHEVLAGNIANIDTPGYQARDLSVADFQARLKQAIDDRDQPQVADHDHGYMVPDVAPAGETDLAPKPLMAEVAESSRAILRHDMGNVDMESQVNEMVKNHMLHNLAHTILSDQFRQMQLAIRGTVT